MKIVETVRTDLRFAMRTLRKSRLYAAAALSSLALAIGATVATFAIIDGLVLRPAPWRRPAEVFLLQRVDAKTGQVTAGWSQARFDVARHALAGSVSDVANFATRGVTLAAPAGDSGVRADAEFVSPTYLRLTGVSPIHGRALDPTAHSDADANTVLISTRLERNLFGGTTAIGKTLRVNGISLTVIGTMPNDFFGLSGRSDLWIPLEAAPAVWAQPEALSQYNFGFRIAVRVPGAWNAAQRRGLLDNLDRELGTGGRASGVGTSGGAVDAPAMVATSHMALASAADALMEPGLRSLLWILLGAASCVLLLACANVASLSVARLTARATELAVRSALGATAIRLAASQLIEASIIGVVGGGLGLGFAAWAEHALWSARPSGGGAAARQFAAAAPPAIDARTIAFAIGVAIVTIVLIGVWPVFEVRRPLGARRASFSAGGRGAGTASPGAGRVRAALSMVQLGLAFVVTTSAVLFVASLRTLTTLNHGFSPAGVLTLRLDLPATRYDGPRARALYDDLLARLVLIPGVKAADLTNSLPLAATDGGTAAAVDLSLPNQHGGRGTRLDYHTVGPAYFRSLGVENVKSPAHSVSASDAVPVIVSRAAANQYWPGRNPIGQSIHELLLAETSGKWIRGEIVGVAPDIQYGAPGAPAEAGVYVSYTDDPPLRAVLIVKAAAEPLGLVAPVRSALRALDPQLVLYDTKTLDARVREVASATRFGSLVLGAYAGVALVIALIGVYSVIAFGVAQRRAEIGIRMALGATREGILSSVLTRGMRVTSAGIVIGVAGSVATQRLLTSHLFGVGAGDLRYYAAVFAAFVLAGLCASVLPALSATRVDPASALRSE
ncbi:MAG: FtsX-like permease family protein [bacterium]